MKLNKSSSALLVLLAMPGVALAQGVAAGGEGNVNPAMACAADQHIDGQLAFIKAELKITDEQTPSWSVFANTFRVNKEKQAASCAQARKQAHSMRSADLLDSMKMMEMHLSEQLDSLRAIDAAIRPLYEALTAEQKKKADEILKGGPGM